jgi:signal transduction histidine kinase
MRQGGYRDNAAGGGRPAHTGEDGGVRERQLAAIARAASSVADAASLDVTLNAVAHAVFDLVGLAGVQILVLRGPERDLEVLGSAGFSDGTEFGVLLAECRRLGAKPDMFRAIDTRRPVMIAHRRRPMLEDPAWAPMHRTMGSFDWDAFVSVPLLARDRCVGVLNAFYPPGLPLHEDAIGFLGAIADQAAMAVDYTELLARSALDARLAERERLTRELHDSVVQQVFSLRLHATALAEQLECDNGTIERANVQKVSHELAELSESALADLRELLFELRPSSLRGGLLDAVRAHASRIAGREGLRIAVTCEDELPGLPPELETDLYRIVQEALHNTVKHANAGSAVVTVSMAGGTDLLMEISDDGRGTGDAEQKGPALGLVSMRERARRWGGSLETTTPPDGGYQVRVVLRDAVTLACRYGVDEEDDQW